MNKKKYLRQAQIIKFSNTFSYNVAKQHNLLKHYIVNIEKETKFKETKLNLIITKIKILSIMEE